MRFDGTSEQLDLLREIADSLSDPVMLVDRAHNVWYHNRAFEAIVGIRLSSRRYKGAPCHKLLQLATCKENCIMQQAVETKQIVRLAEIAGTTADGEPHNFNVNAVPLENSTGTMFGVLVFFRDITAETQIHKKYKELVSRNTAVALSGRIEQGNLIDIIQLVAFLQKTGTLTLEHENSAGEIAFDKGQMVAMTLGNAEGEKALGRLLNWEQGTFAFKPEEQVEVTNRLAKSSDFMLMDAMRERDELLVRKEELPALSAKPHVLRIADRETDELQDLSWQVYELGLEGKPVLEMLDACIEPDTQIYSALLSLRDKGVLEW